MQHMVHMDTLTCKNTLWQTLIMLHVCQTRLACKDWWDFAYVEFA